MEVGGVNGKETPGPGSDPGAVNQGTEGSRVRGAVVVIWLMSLDELRVSGPIALRPWIERRMRSLKKGPGTVVEFGP